MQDNERDYFGQREAAENGTGIDTGGDALVCADCGRPMYYDYADEAYHHAFDCADGCFLIAAEPGRADDRSHPLLVDQATNDVDVEERERLWQALDTSHT